MRHLYYLLDNPNPNGRHYYTTRRVCQHGKGRPHLIVLHTAETLPDWTGPDSAAENVARYAATTSRTVSWHSTIDSDSTIAMLPDEYTAFHVRGYNTCSLGIEMGTQAHKWYGSPDPWRYAVLNRVATQIATWADKWDISITQLTRSQVDAGRSGVVGHATLDPTRRSDPGAAFPWGYIIDRSREISVPPHKFSSHPLTGDEIVLLRKMMAER